MYSIVKNQHFIYHLHTQNYLSNKGEKGLIINVSILTDWECRPLGIVGTATRLLGEATSTGNSKDLHNSHDEKDHS